MMKIKDASLLFFTLCLQMAVGLALGIHFLYFFPAEAHESYAAISRIGHLMVVLLAMTGLASSFFHLKVPLHAWRGMFNLETSWLSREILSVVIFIVSSFLLSFGEFLNLSTGFLQICRWVMLGSGPALIFCMGSAYRLKAVAFWNSRQSILTFFCSAVLLGLLALGVLILLFYKPEKSQNSILIISTLSIACLILLNIYFSIQGVKRMRLGRIPVPQSLAQILKFRIVIGALGFIFCLLFVFLGRSGVYWSWWPVLALAFVSEICGRFLFYQARVPYGVYLLKA